VNRQITTRLASPSTALPRAQPVSAADPAADAGQVRRPGLCPVFPLLVLVGQLLGASRRGGPAPGQAGGLVLDEESREVRIGAACVDLTFREFELLEFLMANPGKVFSRRQLLGQVWGPGARADARTVDVHVHRLRSKLGPRHGARLVTVRRVGYKFVRAC